jgi:hypothetical protein
LVAVALTLSASRARADSPAAPANAAGPAAPSGDVAPPAPLAATPGRARRGEGRATYLSVGPLFSYTAHAREGARFGAGGEVSLVHYLHRPVGHGPAGWWVGAFGQAQAVAAERGRFAGGAQVGTSLFGVEMGGYFDGAGDGRRATAGVHLAPFVSLVYAYLAFRAGIPLTPEGARGDAPHGFEYGVAAAIKWPFGLGP